MSIINKIKDLIDPKIKFKNTNNQKLSLYNRLKLLNNNNIIDEELLEQILVILIEADIDYELSNEICKQLKQQCIINNIKTTNDIINQLYIILYDYYDDNNYQLIFDTFLLLCIHIEETSFCPLF